MRMRRVLTVLLAAVCLVVGVMVATSSARSGGVNRFEVKVIPNLDTEVYYDWGWTLLEEITTTDGEHLGWSGGPCFNLSGDPEVFENFVCDLGMQFPDGTITVNGAINMDEYLEGDTVMAVTGGTGKFRNVSGQVAIIPQEDFSYSTLIFKLKNSRARY
jgi:hypothetical protein